MHRKTHTKPNILWSEQKRNVIAWRHRIHFISLYSPTQSMTTVKFHFTFRQAQFHFSQTRLSLSHTKMKSRPNVLKTEIKFCFHAFHTKEKSPVHTRRRKKTESIVCKNLGNFYSSREQKPNKKQKSNQQGWGKRWDWLYKAQKVGSYNFGFVGGLNLQTLNLLPDNSPEKGVVFDVTLSIGIATQSLGWILGQQLDQWRHNVRSKGQTMQTNIQSIKCIMSEAKDRQWKHQAQTVLCPIRHQSLTWLTA